MALTRREMIGLGIAAVLCPLAQPAEAHHFVNRAGLAPGQFVWEPSQPQHGPVVILVSPTDRIVHVYKNGTLIGISTCDVPRSRDRKVVGVFWLDGHGTEAEGRTQHADAVIRSRDLMWSGRALYGEHLRTTFGRVSLPTPFARLLSEATGDGALLIVASNRTEAFETALSGALLPSSAAAARADAAQSARHTSTGFQIDADIDGTAVVISRAARSAVLVRDGIPVKRLNVRFAEPSRRIGTHVFSLTKPGSDGSSRWLGFGIGQSVTAHPQTKRRAGDVLSQIAFEDKAAGAALMSQLHAGSPLIVMDAPLSGGAQRPPKEQVILAAQSARGQPQPRTRTVHKARPPARKKDAWASFFVHGIN